MSMPMSFNDFLSGVKAVKAAVRNLLERRLFTFNAKKLGIPSSPDDHGLLCYMVVRRCVLQYFLDLNLTLTVTLSVNLLMPSWTFLFTWKFVSGYGHAAAKLASTKNEGEI